MKALIGYLTNFSLVSRVFLFSFSSFVANVSLMVVVLLGGLATCVFVYLLFSLVVCCLFVLRLFLFWVLLLLLQLRAFLGFFFFGEFWFWGMYLVQLALMYIPSTGSQWG